MLINAPSNRIGNQATKDLRPAIEAEPDTHTCALLGFSVPLGGDQSEARRDGTLTQAEEEPDGKSPTIVAHCCHTTQDSSPSYDSASAELPNRKSLQEAVCRVFERQISEVEHRRHPGIVVPDKANVFLKAHDRSVLFVAKSAWNSSFFYVTVV